MKNRYVLLKLKPRTDDLFLILQERGDCAHDCKSGCDYCRHLYEEKLCSSDILEVARQFVARGEDDPHFLFEFIALAESNGTQELPNLFRDVLGESNDKN